MEGLKAEASFEEVERFGLDISLPEPDEEVASVSKTLDHAETIEADKHHSAKRVNSALYKGVLKVYLFLILLFMAFLIYTPLAYVIGILLFLNVLNDIRMILRERTRIIY